MPAQLECEREARFAAEGACAAAECARAATQKELSEESSAHQRTRAELQGKVPCDSQPLHAPVHMRAQIPAFLTYAREILPSLFSMCSSIFSFVANRHMACVCMLQDAKIAYLRELYTQKAEELKAIKAALASSQDEVRELRCMGDQLMRKQVGTEQVAAQQSAAAQAVIEELSQPPCMALVRMFSWVLPLEYMALRACHSTLHGQHVAEHMQLMCMHATRMHEGYPLSPLAMPVQDFFRLGEPLGRGAEGYVQAAELTMPLAIKMVSILLHVPHALSPFCL